MENDNLKEKNRNNKEESLTEINDNNRMIIYEEKSKEFKESGYDNEIIYNEQEEPQAIVIYGEDKTPIAKYSMENGLEIYANEGLELVELSEEDKKRLEAGVEAKKIDKEELKELEGKTDEEKQNEEEKEKEDDSEKSIEELEEELQEQTGSEYEIIGKMPDTGNEKIAGKIRETEGFTGNIYKVKNKTTGQISLAGIGPDGKIKEVSYRRIQAPIGKEIIEHKADGKVKSTTFKSSELIILPGTNVALDGTDKELNAVVNYNGENPQSFRVEVEPTVERTTSKEVDEMKQDSEKMGELTQIIDTMVEKGYITKEDGDRKLGQIANDGKDLDENIEELKDLLKEKENEQSKEEDEEEYDPRDPRYKDPRWN